MGPMQIPVALHMWDIYGPVYVRSIWTVYVGHVWTVYVGSIWTVYVGPIIMGCTYGTYTNPGILFKK